MFCEIFTSILLAIPVISSLRLDAGTRVINDTSMWDTESLPSVTTNETWSGLTPSRVQWGYDEFEPDYVRGMNLYTNEMMHMSGGVRTMTNAQRDILRKHFDRLRGAENAVVIDNGNYVLVIRDFGRDISSSSLTSFRLVRMFEVRSDRITSQVSPTSCDCVFDLDLLQFTIGVTDGGRLNVISDSCPGTNFCIMSSQATLTPFADPGFSRKLKMVMDTLIQYELVLAKRKCKRSDTTADVSGFIRWFVYEKPKSHVFTEALTSKEWNILC